MSLDERFEIGSAIHIGQIATAYEAIQRGLDRKVLLKVIHPQWKNDPELLERFHREGKAAAKVSHHNVVKIFDSGWEDGLPYIVLEWIDGGTLADRLQGGPLPQDEVKKIAVELLKGLSAVHQAKLLHRDIKPDNIMLGTDGEARLTDFSLAGLGHLSTLTGHDGIVGSPAYMAPELLHGTPPNVRSDLYAVGIVLLEALTGSNPFQAANPIASLALVEKTNPPKLSGKPRLNQIFAGLIDALLSRDPNQRPESAESALRMLNGQTNELVSQPALPSIPLEQKWGNFRHVVLGFVTLIILTILILAGDSSRFIAPQAAIRRVNPVKHEVPSTTPETKPDESHLGIQMPDPLPGKLVLFVNPWGNVFIDGRPVGTTPMDAIELSHGIHLIEVKHPQLPGVKKKFLQNSAVTDTLTVDLFREAISVIFTAIPWGYLWIDGDSLGLLPRSDPVWLTAGNHVIKISHPDYAIWSETIAISAGDRINYKVDLTNGTSIAVPLSGEIKKGGE